MADQLSAEIEDRFGAGPPTQAPIVRVRDLIVCAGDPSNKVPIEEVYAHPPIGWDRRRGEDDERFGEIVDTIDLGGGIAIERLDRDTTELVMNACTPRGHYFLPVRQFGQRYSLVKEVSLDELDERHYAWDTDGTLDDALTLSRLVRDNGYSTEYAARLLDYEDGQRCIVYVLHREDKAIWRLHRDREWLDAAEGRELAALLAAYWECREQLPPRVRRAMWRMAYAPRIRWADMVVPGLIGGIEALLKIGRRDLTQQFKKRDSGPRRRRRDRGPFRGPRRATLRRSLRLGPRLPRPALRGEGGRQRRHFSGGGAGGFAEQRRAERPCRGRPASRCSPQRGSPSDRGRRVSSGLRR